MNPGGLSLRTLLETFVRMVDERLKAAQGARGSGRDPLAARLVLFPKRVHELGLREGQTPDGLGPAYVRLAAELNGASLAVQASEADRLLGSVEQVVSTAVIHERALVALLQKNA